MKILEKLPIVKKKNKTIKWFQTYSKNLYENLKIQWEKNEELEEEIKKLKKKRGEEYVKSSSFTRKNTK